MSEDYESGPLGAGTPRASVDTSRHEETAPERPLDLIEVAGRIKWFDVSKGFGFIVPDSGMPDVLLHITCLRRDGIAELKPGERVLVRFGDGGKGLMAAEVRLADGTLPASH